MTINYPDYPANWTPLANDAADASFVGTPMSRFAKGGRAGTKPFEIVPPREHVEKMAKGGLAQQAKNVKQAGVGGDTMVIHINRDEYNQLCKEWGHPTINPHTGLPQWTPFWKQSWFAPVAALAGTALMATGVGASLGAGLFSTLGVADAGLGAATGIGALGATPVSTVVGNAALGAGIGGLTGGTKGALTSGLLAGAGTVGASALGSYLGGGTSGLQPMGALEPSAASVGPYGPQVPAGSEAAFKAISPDYVPTSSSGGGIMNALKGFATDPNKMAAAAVTLGAMAGGGGSQAAPTINAPTSTATDPNLTKRLPTTPMERIRLAGPLDYYNYGAGGEHLYYAPQAITQGTAPAVQAAEGGPLSHYVQGGGTGRSDSIPAKLSDGEYVMDAETVSLLGDGSSKAGAQKLDQFRANIRKQKGKALAQGKFSPDAESPERYLMGGRA